MKVLFLLFAFVFLANTNLMHAQEQRKKVGVVLSGGGAKGVAHIGALKVIEEAGIPIDYIVGTSMGSIVGGLYAIGYSSEQLDSMVRKQNWLNLLSDKIQHKDLSMIDREITEKYVLSVPYSLKEKLDPGGGILRGSNLANLFNELTVGYHDSLDFTKFPIPFACVAYNLVNGTEVDFKSGILSTAMRASMAIPAAFTPVRLNDMVLVDGGVINNYPVNIAREMGADYIIGVDVRSDLKSAEELTKTPDLLGQLIDLMGLELYQKNIEDTDTYIQVDVEGYSAASFSNVAIDSLIARGSVAAKHQLTSLLGLREELVKEGYLDLPQKSHFSSAANRKVYVSEITFHGMDAKDKSRILRRCQLVEDSEVSIEQIEEAIAILTSYMGYAGVNYNLKNSEKGGYHLTYIAERKYQNKINLGVRFDTEETASVEVNAINYFNTTVPSNLTFTGRFGKRYKASLNYSFEPSPLKRFGLTYMFQYSDVDYSQAGDKTHNAAFRYHMGEFLFTDTWKRNLRVDLGVSYEHYNYNKFLYIDDEQNRTNINREHFFNYFVKIRYSTFDDPYFPRRGVSANASYVMHTDNFIQYDDSAPISVVQGNFRGAVPITNRFAILPSIHGRLLFFEEETPYSKLNTLGGDVENRFLFNQIPFIGINGSQIMDDFLLVGALKFRQRIGGVHYVYLTTNYALSSDRLRDLFQENSVLGFGVGYGMNTMFGPLEAIISYTNRSKKVGLYINLGFKF
ncbi:MAG: patatin-like phospholipase family protein [Phocaeicola sp.]